MQIAHIIFPPCLFNLLPKKAKKKTQKGEKTALKGKICPEALHFKIRFSLIARQVCVITKGGGCEFDARTCIRLRNDCPRYGEDEPWGNEPSVISLRGPHPYDSVQSMANFSHYLHRELL